MACFLLALLFLYNPFISLVHSSHGLSIHHLSRNRSTVGAGELQNFSLQSKTAAVKIFSVLSVGVIPSAPAKVGFPLALDFEPAIPVFQWFTSDLFFRPPPSV
jgi:hypothetical protein